MSLSSTSSFDTPVNVINSDDDDGKGSLWTEIDNTMLRGWAIVKDYIAVVSAYAVHLDQFKQERLDNGCTVVSEPEIILFERVSDKLQRLVWMAVVTQKDEIPVEHRIAYFQYRTPDHPELRKRLNDPELAAYLIERREELKRQESAPVSARTRNKRTRR